MTGRPFVLCVANRLFDTASGIARRRDAFEPTGIDRLSIEENRQLVGDAEVRRADTPLVQQTRDFPLVMRAIAECDGGAQPIIVAKTDLADLSLLTRFLEIGIVRHALVEEIIELAEIVFDRAKIVLLLVFAVFLLS